jgi:hypothetical protein
MSAFTSSFLIGTFDIASPPMITSTFGFSLAGPRSPAYRYYPHICDFLAFVSSRSRDKDLLGMQTPYGNRKEFNKWCAGVHTSIIDNLVTVFKL